MKNGICQLPIIPLRKAPSETSEMISQVLFGETFEIIESLENWCRITLDQDYYTGWISANMCHPLTDKKYREIQDSEITLSSGITILQYGDANQMILAPGSRFYNYIPGKGGEYPFLDSTFKVTNYLETVNTGVKIDIIELARSYSGSPYLWGGKTPFGIDCSGFVQVIFSIIGVQLPRDTKQQVEKGTTIEFIQDSKPGDLAFFGVPGGKINHVGLISGSGKIIHASGWVKEESLDSEGIYNTKGNYTHMLRLIKRV